MRGDDEGDNISRQNPMYNEMTAVYEVWKNMPEYDCVGLMHYRRHFVFDAHTDRNYYSVKKMHRDYLTRELHYRPGVVEEIMSDEKSFVCVAQDRNKTVREHYTLAHGALGIELTENVIHEKFPEYGDAAARYFDGRTEYLYNMFIMRRDVFERYCKFVFGVLAEVKNVVGGRLFLSERITGVFMTKLLDEGLQSRAPARHVRARPPVPRRRHPRESPQPQAEQDPRRRLPRPHLRAQTPVTQAPARPRVFVVLQQVEQE